MDDIQVSEITGAYFNVSIQGPAYYRLKGISDVQGYSMSTALEMLINIAITCEWEGRKLLPEA
jgi:hypothetical protein